MQRKRHNVLFSSFDSCSLLSSWQYHSMWSLRRAEIKNIQNLSSSSKAFHRSIGFCQDFLIFLCHLKRSFFKDNSLNECATLHFYLWLCWGQSSEANIQLPTSICQARQRKTKNGSCLTGSALLSFAYNEKEEEKQRWETTSEVLKWEKCRHLVIY